MRGGSTPPRFRFAEVVGILLNGRLWRSWQPIRLSAVTAVEYDSKTLRNGGT